MGRHIIIIIHLVTILEFLLLNLERGSQTRTLGFDCSTTLGDI